MPISQQLKIIKNRSDIGAGTRGSDMGIDALEVAAINQENDFFIRFPYEDVRTHNETVYNKVHNSFAKRIGHVYEQCVRVAESVQRSLADGFFPLVLSGDHSSALGTMSGIKAHYPDRCLGVVWIDAHADVHSPYTSPSGNIHGMPLAAAMQDDNMVACINNPVDDTKRHWEAMKRIGTPMPKVEGQHVVYWGVRDTEPAEDQQMARLNMRNFTVPEVRFRGLGTCVSETLDRLSNCDLIYVSFDVDSMDADMVSHGTGTPVSKGFDPLEVMALLDGLMASRKIVALEVVEINPLLDDRGNRMAETAFQVLDHAVGKIPRSAGDQWYPVPRKHSDIPG